MNNKNWNDRADKDLFFTILSVKNIGVISGAEWTTIGNHMRTMGYGFTNEGCRYVKCCPSLPVSFIFEFLFLVCLFSSFHRLYLISHVPFIMPRALPLANS